MGFLFKRPVLQEKKTMSESIDDGGSAFPTPHGHHAGMSLLDYFAGQALAGLLAGETASTYAAPRVAYSVAVAMLNERERINAKRD